MKDEGWPSPINFNVGYEYPHFFAIDLSQVYRKATCWMADASLDGANAVPEIGRRRAQEGWRLFWSAIIGSQMTEDRFN